MRKSLLVAALSVAAAFTWQALAVHYRYAGNWTALYCTGDRWARPPLGEDIWLFPNSYGYDGQMYHYIAHDPWFQRGFTKFIDAPRVRYHRILLPGLAHLLAFGEDRYVDPAYLSVVLLCIFLGGWWLSKYAALHGFSRWWGLAFLLVPAVLTSIDRLTVDVGLAAICVGFVFYVEAGPAWPLYALLLAAPLIRDTGFLLVAGYVGAQLLERKWARAAAYLSAGLPALFWYFYVARHADADHVPWFGSWPLEAFGQRLLHPIAYPFPPLIALGPTILDYLSLAGIAVGLVWAAKLLLGKSRDAGSLSIYGFALLAVMMSYGDFWSEAYSFGRTLTPLLLLLALDGMAKRRYAMAFPLFLVVPRVLLQYAPIAWRIVRGII